MESHIFSLGKIVYNVDWAKAHIASGRIAPANISFDIGEWGRKMLGLDARHPKQKPKSFLIGIDLADVDLLPESAIAEPILVVDSKIGRIVIDGNLRVAKAYLAGLTSVPAILISKQDEAILLEQPKELSVECVG